MDAVAAALMLEGYLTRRRLEGAKSTTLSLSAAAPAA